MHLAVIIPIIGTLNFLCSSGIATDEAVLHATIIALTSLLNRNFVFWMEYSITVEFDFEPYGTRAVSPK